MTAQTFWCRSCLVGFALFTKQGPPDVCPSCRATSQPNEAWWARESPTPKYAFNLTMMDRRLLHGLRIDPEG
jgi:hypothetical protein